MCSSAKAQSLSCSPIVAFKPEMQANRAKVQLTRRVSLSSVSKEMPAEGGAQIGLADRQGCTFRYVECQMDLCDSCLTQCQFRACAGPPNPSRKTGSTSEHRPLLELSFKATHCGRRVAAGSVSQPFLQQVKPSVVNSYWG